jgi:hypothetical protein
LLFRKEIGKSGQAEVFAEAKLLPVFIIHKLLIGANGPLIINYCILLEDLTV